MSAPGVKVAFKIVKKIYKSQISLYSIILFKNRKENEKDFLKVLFEVC